MPHRKPPGAPVFFRTAAEFRAWLRTNGAIASALLVGFHKVGSGRPSITWPESVDEALAAGWIDGVRRRIDDESYSIRFTPRTKNSIWSAVNVARARALLAEGRMRPAGKAAFERRTERTSSVYSYEQAGRLKLSPHELRLFRKNRAAWKYFEGAPPGYRKLVTHWVVSAKQPATRERRLGRLIESCAAGVRVFP